ncbi:MAG: BamA/TamA family outer membrane protein [Myxococcales bacterium]|nr:BamA/TamA family outer membrane protein [Myxococcales bacterium]
MRRSGPLALLASWPLLACALAAPTLAWTSLAEAQAVRTWGAEPDGVPPENPSAAPPEPPPATLGTPVPGSTSAPLPAARPGSTPVAPPPPSAPQALGLKYALEGIEVRGNTATLARVVLRYVPFRAGDVLDVEDRELELTRFRLLSTGFFRDVQLSLRRGTRRGNVVLVVSVTERNTIVVDDVWLGVSSSVSGNGSVSPLTAYGGAKVTEMNLAGTGAALGGAFAVADSQLALRARVADSQFLRSNWLAEAEVLYNGARDFFGNGDVLVSPSPASPGEAPPPPSSAQAYAVAQYKRFGGRIAVGHDLGVSSQLTFEYRLEKVDANLPLAASDHRGLDVEPIDFMLIRGSSVLSAIGATLVTDTRDEPFLPTRGQYLLAGAAASLTPIGSDYPYLKLTLRASQWFPLPWGHVLHLEGFAGGVFGNAPLFERFYVGDLSDLLPDRVLGLNFDPHPALNILGTDIVEIRYGNYAAKVDAEYRVPLYRGSRSIYGVDFFASFGAYGLANDQDLVAHARGYSGLAVLPLDLTFNAGLRIDTQAGGFVFGVSNLVGLGLVPVRGPRQGAAGR